MKYTLLACSLLALCTHNTLLPMDKENITQPLRLQPIVMNANQQQHQLICTIDAAINKKCCSQNYFSDITNIFASHFISEEEMYNIIGIVTQYCEEIPNDALFDDLYVRNSFFSKTVDYFTILAQKNLANLTAQNLKTIENPKQIQPTLQLNKLTLPIKKYIMQRAFKTITYTYDIALIGHKEDICAFDICEATHQAITASQTTPYNPDNNSLYLWNLKTGKFERLNEERPIRLLAFSTDGNYIAAALFDKNCIHLWCPKTKQILMNIDTHYRTESMEFTYPINHTLITTHRPNMTTQIMQQWALAERMVQKGESLCHNKTMPAKNHSIFMGATYNPSSFLCLETRPFFPKNKLCVQKKSIPLYLCIQAIKNSQNTRNIQNTIEQSSSYQALTDLEKPIVTDEIRKKTAALKAIPQRAITQPLLHINS